VLIDALRHQRASGGRIGTCLVELEKISEDDLLHVLSDQLKVPFTPAEELRTLTDEIVKLIPEKVARQRFSVPIKSSSTHITVAMRDPADLIALDELAFVTGKRIRPQVASEIRILEALSRFYGVELASRFVKLLDRLNRDPLPDAREQESPELRPSSSCRRWSCRQERRTCRMPPAVAAARRGAAARGSLASANPLAPIVSVYGSGTAAPPAPAAARPVVRRPRSGGVLAGGARPAPRLVPTAFSAARRRARARAPAAFARSGRAAAARGRAATRSANCCSSSPADAASALLLMVRRDEAAAGSASARASTTNRSRRARSICARPRSCARCAAAPQVHRGALTRDAGCRDPAPCSAPTGPPI
jgi:hypothetical protein